MVLAARTQSEIEAAKQAIEAAGGSTEAWPLDVMDDVAVRRSIGEAAVRAKSVEPADMIAHVRSTDFDLAAFKGRKLTYRAWNGQLRQPILIATAKLPVTVSPQPGFLHQFSELDTLGIDKPETGCRAYAP